MRHSQEKILKILRDRGDRLTPVRSALVKVFVRDHRPLSVPEITALLRKSGLQTNKTTVYRQLEILVGGGILETVNFEDGKIRYEIAGTHHHHLVCLRCEKVADIELSKDLQIFSADLKRSRFQVMRHALEFYGLCANCQKKS